ncbi:MAG: transcriptional regulator [Streptococcus sp.]|nr:MAG: transcriptional regulator [Streptococcus sp.]
MIYKKLNLGEPNIGTLYGIEELEALLREFEDFIFENSSYNPSEQIELFEEAFSSYIGTEFAISVNSGMSALEVILFSLFRNQKAKIISNAINFHGTHLSVINHQIDLILCESDEDLNVSYDDLFEKISKIKPDAILLTNMNGLAHDELRIKDFLMKASPKTLLIMDCCRSLGSKCRGEKAGKNADVAFFSFQRKKQITTLGEGGMIVTNNSLFVEKFKEVRSFGLGIQNGANYKLTSFQARVGIEQIKKIDYLNNLRRGIAHRRTNFLENKLNEFIFPRDDEDFYNTFYLYSMLVPKSWSSKERDLLIDILSTKYSIGSVVANDVTYKTSVFLKKNIRERCKESEKIAERIICPIIHPNLTLEEENYINKSIIKAVYQIVK